MFAVFGISSPLFFIIVALIIIALAIRSGVLGQIVSAVSTSLPAPPDNVLVSGNGKGNSAIIFWWAGFVISAIMVFAIPTYYANDLESQVAGVQGELFVNRAALAQVEQRVAILRAMSVLLPILALVHGVFYHRCITGTYIHVNSNGIEGKGAGKGFIWGDPRLFGFHLGYGQISSVDRTENAIFIHASDAQYKCYVKNPAEIQKVIMEQQQRAASGAK